MRHRHRPLRTAAAAAVLLALALAGPASAAAPPPPKLVAKDLNGGSPTVVVDASGGTLVVWETSVNGFQRIATSYRAKGRKAFGRTVIVPLGAGLQSASDPSVAALGNELRIAFTGQVSGAGSTWVARSTNRGASWSVTRLPDVDGKAYASYSSNSTVITAAGIDGLFGDSTGLALIHVSPDLKTATTTPFVTGYLGDPQIARGADGTIYAVGNGATGLATLAGSHAGSIQTPGCAGAGDVRIAAGASSASVVLQGCGTVWTTTIAKTGAVGPLRRLSTVAAQYIDLAGVRRGPKGFFTAFVGTDGDIRIARSKDGVAWKVLAGVVPSAQRDPGTTVSVGVDGTGAVAWARGYIAPRGIWFAPAAGRVGPARISTRGLARAQVVRLGTAAVAASRSISWAAFQKAPRLQVRLAASSKDPFAVVDVVARRRAQLQTALGGIVDQVTGIPGKGTRIVRIPVDVSDMRYFGIKRGDLLEVDLATRNGRATLQIRLT